MWVLRWNFFKCFILCIYNVRLTSHFTLVKNWNIRIRIRENVGKNVLGGRGRITFQHLMKNSDPNLTTWFQIQCFTKLLEHSSLLVLFEILTNSINCHSYEKFQIDKFQNRSCMHQKKVFLNCQMSKNSFKKTCTGTRTFWEWQGQ